MKYLLLISTFIAFVLGNMGTSPNGLLRRQACAAGTTQCGSICIKNGYTCCPDLKGGCDPSVARCWLGSNNQYGCCANSASKCAGPGGVRTDYSYGTSTPALVATTSYYYTPAYTTPTGAFVFSSTTRVTTTSRLLFSTTTPVVVIPSATFTAVATSSMGAPFSFGTGAAQRSAYSPLAALSSLILAIVAFVV